MNASLSQRCFWRAIANPPKVAPLVRELYPIAEQIFKDAYSLEFLGLSEPHDELDLHGALLRNLGRFLTELGRDFCFVGSEYPPTSRQTGLFTGFALVSSWIKRTGGHRAESLSF